MTYRAMREFLKGEGIADAQITAVIEAEKANRALIEHQTQQQLDLERRRVGTVKGERVKRKAIE
jgi:hypothetical protein